MTCSIFTIVKTYFTCCVTKKNENDAQPENIPGSGDSSPYSFDDLTSDGNSNTISSWSSTSSLEDYYISPSQGKKHQFPNDKQIHQQRLVKRYYAEVYGIQ
jgi:hypothetical protein